MKILQAVPKDLVEVLYLLKICVSDMNERGHKHWNNAYPGNDYVIESINSGSLYLIKDKGVAKGMMILTDVEPEEYKSIEWKTSGGKAIYIRFVAVHPNWTDEGIAKKLLEYSEGYAKENDFTVLRVDVYSGEEGAEKNCEDLGYNQSGKFHSSFQKTPYIAYEKGV